MHKLDNQKGFTLIELAIVIIITGVIFTALIRAYVIYNEKQKIERMKIYMTSATQALENYPNRIDPASATNEVYGRLPCPAPLDSVAAGNMYSVEAAPPNCSGTIRVGTADGDVFIGKFPANTLNLNNASMRDIYGNYLLYAVTAAAVDRPSYSSSVGAITIREKDINPSTGAIEEIAPKTNIQYALISPGASSLGAVGFDGNLVHDDDACIAGSDEEENCLNLTIPSANDATFMVSLLSDNRDDSFYDDVVSFSGSLPGRTSHFKNLLTPAIEGVHYSVTRGHNNNWVEVEILKDTYGHSYVNSLPANTNSGRTFTDNRFVAFEPGDMVRFDERGGMEIRDDDNVILYQHRAHPANDLSVDDLESRKIEDNLLYLSNPAQPSVGNITPSRGPDTFGGEGDDGFYQRTFKLWYDHEY